MSDPTKEKKYDDHSNFDEVLRTYSEVRQSEKYYKPDKTDNSLTSKIRLQTN